MIEQVLTDAGVKHRRARFTSPPADTYAVFFDDKSIDGADPVGYAPAEGLPRIYHHDVRVELYEPKPDDAAEAAIEAALNSRGLPWDKTDRVWLQDVQRYQVSYFLAYTSKI